MTLPRWFRYVVFAIFAAHLSACDFLAMKELQPGISTATEVRARLGNPAQEYRNADGTVTWEFNRQPNGTECWMVTLGPDQILRKIEQVLTEANFAKVTAGMDRDEVRRLLGAPGWKTLYKNLNEEIWDWRVAGTIPTEEAHFHVHFDAGTGLVKTTSRRIEPKA